MAVLGTIDVLVAHHVAAVGQAVDHRHAGALHASGNRHVDVLGAPAAAAIAGYLVRQQLVEPLGLVLLAGVVRHQAAIVEHAQVGFPHAVVVLVLGPAAALDDRAEITPGMSAVVRGVELQVFADHPAPRVIAGGIGGQQHGARRQRAAGTRQLVQVGLPAQLPAGIAAMRLVGDVLREAPVALSRLADVQRNAAHAIALERQQHAAVGRRVGLVGEPHQHRIAHALRQHGADGCFVRLRCSQRRAGQRAQTQGGGEREGGRFHARLRSGGEMHRQRGQPGSAGGTAAAIAA